jgi:hypothetical protein
MIKIRNCWSLPKYWKCSFEIFCLYVFIITGEPVSLEASYLVLPTIYISCKETSNKIIFDECEK